MWCTPHIENQVSRFGVWTDEKAQNGYNDANPVPHVTDCLGTDLLKVNPAFF